MNGFEMLLCCLLVPVAYVLIYIAGRYNVLALVCKALEEWARSLRHGRWEDSHISSDGFAVVKCSSCGHEAFAVACYVKEGNFCPFCGAKMGGSKNG